MSNDWRNGFLRITTRKDETGSIRVVNIEPNRNKNIPYNEEENNLKGDVVDDE